MKRIILLISTFSILFAARFPYLKPAARHAHAADIAGGDKFSLWVDGPHLRGANIWQAVVIPDLDGLEFKGPGPYGPPFTQQDFDQLAALGANYVVISGPGLFRETPPYQVMPEAVENLDNLLAMIANADMFATIAFRTGPGRSEFRLCCEGEPDFEPYYNDAVWQDQTAQDAWVEMWRYTAERYRDNPIVVGYKLMVEPNPAGLLLDIYNPDEFYPHYAGTLYDWNQLYPRLVAGIRQVDGETPILVSGMGWSAVDWLPYLRVVNDPRIVYVVHQYEPQKAYTHQEEPRNSYPGRYDLDDDGRRDDFNKTWLEDFLSPINDFMAANHVPVAVDEFGVVRWAPGGAQFMDDQMAWFEEHGLNYALWEWATSYAPFANEVNAFNFRLGPGPHNLAPVENDLQDVILRYWSKNTLRPSNWAVPSNHHTQPDQPTWWQPAPGITWQWQLDGEEVDTSVDVDMYDVDLFDTNSAVVDALHAQGRKVVCYLSAGSWENWRPDAGDFPEDVIGNDYDGWPGEKWLDIRQIEVLAPILRARLDLCAAKGFDGVEPDNIDGHTNDTGFPLTRADQIAFNIWLAEEAHSRGLSIGLKNTPQLVGELLPYFDWALTEDCFAEGWCAAMSPFIAAGKAVFAAEYTDSGIALQKACSQARALGFSLIYKRRQLDAWRQACP